MKTSALPAATRPVTDPKATSGLSLEWVERLERRLSPRPSEFLSLGVCLERVVTNMHAAYAARQVELLRGVFSQATAELAADEKPLLPAAPQASPPTKRLLKFRGRPASPRTPVQLKARAAKSPGK